MLTIVGPMRSGTSLVARIAHQLGIDMGTSMRLPPAGSGLDPEYEDQPLAEFLAYRALGRQELHDYLTFKDYVVHRQRRTHGKPWGFKSPLLALYWDEWKQALEQVGEPLVVVACHRGQRDCLESLRRAAPTEETFSVLEEIQCRMEFDLYSMVQDSQPELIHFGTPPQEIARRLVTLMGLTDYEEATAIRGIRT